MKTPKELKEEKQKLKRYMDQCSANIIKLNEHRKLHEIELKTRGLEGEEIIRHLENGTPGRSIEAYITKYKDLEHIYAQRIAEIDEEMSKQNEGKSLFMISIIATILLILLIIFSSTGITGNLITEQTEENTIHSTPGEIIRGKIYLTEIMDKEITEKYSQLMVYGEGDLTDDLTISKSTISPDKDDSIEYEIGLPGNIKEGKYYENIKVRVSSEEEISGDTLIYDRKITVAIGKESGNHRLLFLLIIMAITTSGIMMSTFMDNKKQKNKLPIK